MILLPFTSISRSETRRSLTVVKGDTRSTCQMNNLMQKSVQEIGVESWELGLCTDLAPFGRDQPLKVLQWIGCLRYWKWRQPHEVHLPPVSLPITYPVLGAGRHMSGPLSSTSRTAVVCWLTHLVIFLFRHHCVSSHACRSPRPLHAGLWPCFLLSARAAVTHIRVKLHKLFFHTSDIGRNKWKYRHRVNNSWMNEWIENSAMLTLYHFG